MDSIIVNFFSSLGWWGQLLLAAIQLVCSALFAGLIGYEREVNGHAAGLRTHILVSGGACLIMIISISAPGFGDGARDPARLAAQVVSGIGFLGAGTIIQNGIDVKGLTTAATIWLCGGIGLACGSGYFSVAIIATVVSFITLTLLTKIEVRVNRRSPRIVMMIEASEPVLKDIMELSNVYSVEIRGIHSTIVKQKENCRVYRLVIQLSPNSAQNTNVFADELKYRLNPIEFKIYNR